MPNILLPLSNKRQRQTADCLAACAFMVLSHLGMTIAHEELLKLLKVKSFGAAGQNLKNLSSLSVKVIYREGSVSELKQHLEAGFPCVVLVRTAELSYWSYSTDHAVVVVGFDDDFIFVNDPAFDSAPLQIAADCADYRGLNPVKSAQSAAFHSSWWAIAHGVSCSCSCN